MAPIPQAKTKSKAEQEAQQKTVRRAEQANILAGVRAILEQDEQLLAFARARVAGGWRSKLNVGPEAFFAPFVNLALTERRFLVQHVQHASGKPSQMLPHGYPFDKVAKVTFTDIETYGGEPACRLILHLENGLYVRLRLRGLLNFESGKNIAELFDSLTTAKRATPPSPIQQQCPQCKRALDQPCKFCPYCGTQQPPRTNGTAESATPTAQTGITLATPEQGTETPVVQMPPSAVQIPTAISIPRETDFAYEREDRPAEFGFALPLPDSITLPEETTEGTGEPLPTETKEETALDNGVTLSKEAASDTESTLEPFGEDDLFLTETDRTETDRTETDRTDTERTETERREAGRSEEPEETGGGEAFDTQAMFVDPQAHHASDPIFDLPTSVFPESAAPAVPETEETGFAQYEAQTFAEPSTEETPLTTEAALPTAELETPSAPAETEAAEATLSATEEPPFAEEAAQIESTSAATEEANSAVIEEGTHESAETSGEVASSESSPATPGKEKGKGKRESQ